MVDCPTIPLTRDIDDPEGKDQDQGLDCKAFHDRIAATIEVAKSALENDIKPEIEQSTDAKDHGHRHVLSSFLSGMKDTLSVIRLIHQKYYDASTSELICAIPLTRGLVESVFTIAVLLRFPQMFASFEQVSEANEHYRHVYLKQESKNLSRLFSGYSETSDKHRNSLLNIHGFLEIPFMVEEVNAIDNLAEQGKNLPNQYRFLTPMGVLDRITKDFPDDQILVVLKRLYIEYKWLCEYTHFRNFSLSMAGYLRLKNVSESDKQELKEKEIVWPIIVTGFLSALIVLTDISQHINKPEELRVRLINDWDFFTKNCLLGIFAWDNWAKNTMGLIR